MLIVPTTFKSVSIRPFMKMNLHSDCHAVLETRVLISINVSTLIKIVIVISRFLERSQKRSRGNQLIHRRLFKQNREAAGQKFRVREHTKVMLLANTTLNVRLLIHISN